MRRGPSLEPRRKLGASYGKETRNGGPYNVSACDGPRGHTHVLHRRALALSRIFRIFLVTVSTPCLPSRDQSAQAFPVFTALSPPPQIKTGEGLGPRLYNMYMHVHLCFVTAEPVRALSLQVCTCLSSNQWLKMTR